MRKQEIDSPVFKQVWENAFDAMRLVDSRGNFILVNNAYCRMVDMPREKLIGQNISITYEKEEREHIQNKLIERFGKRNIPDQFDRPLVLWNGKEVWFDTSNNYIETADQGVVLLSIFRDITEKKKAEDEARKYSEELKKLNATKDKFFSLLSHDLRGPFQSLLGLTDLMVDELETLSREEIQEYIESLQRSLKAQYGLVENLLSWSRLQTGNMPVRKEDVLLGDLINQVTEVMEGSFIRKNITPNIRLPRDIEMSTDANMVTSILQNLLSNAIKFTEAGGKITIGAEYRDADEKEVSIFVQDTGMGMEEEVRKMILDVSSKYTRKGTLGEKGTGLGLVICRELAELQGGSLEVKSKPEVGSTFYLYLPVR